MRKVSWFLLIAILFVGSLSAQNGKDYAEQIQRFEQFVQQQMQRDPRSLHRVYEE